MAKWIKFEEKKPRAFRELLLWHPIRGVLAADNSVKNLWVKTPDLKHSIILAQESTHWQYAPKGPKEKLND